MRALVTGGAGFIGSNLTRLLLQDGHEVTILDDLSSGHAINLEGLRTRFVRGDIRDEKAVAEASEGASAIFHLAASVGNKRSIDHPLLDSEINVLGTLRILETARKRDIPKVVFSSSAGIFGEPKQMPLREDHPTEPDSPYGAAKLAAEKHCLTYAKLYGMRCVALRYFNVYGVNQRYDTYGNVIPIFAHKMLAGQPLTIFGDGEQTRDFVHVADVAQANYRSAITKDAWGAFNIGSGEKITINRLVREMEQASGIKVAVQHGPERPGDVRHSLADISAARKAFDYDPQMGHRQGLREYFGWARSAGV